MRCFGGDNRRLNFFDVGDRSVPHGLLQFFQLFLLLLDVHSEVTVIARFEILALWWQLDLHADVGQMVEELVSLGFRRQAVMDVDAKGFHPTFQRHQIRGRRQHTVLRLNVRGVGFVGAHRVLPHEPLKLGFQASQLFVVTGLVGFQHVFHLVHRLGMVQ